MAVVRRKRSDNFAIIPNAVSDDAGLSFEARGLLVYLLAKPHDWEVNVTNIQRAGGIGKDKAYRLLNDLKGAGYVSHEVIRDEKTGRIKEHTYTVYDCAVPSRLPLPENPEVARSRVPKMAETGLLPENPDVDTPLPENPASGKPGSNNNNEYIINTNPPYPQNDEPEHDILFSKIWDQLSKDNRPDSRNAAFAEFMKLNATDQVAASENFQFFLKERYWRSQKPKLIPYLKKRGWLQFVNDPEQDAEGYFIIKSYRPEWSAWLEEITENRGDAAAKKTRSLGYALCKRRWPSDPASREAHGHD